MATRLLPSEFQMHCTVADFMRRFGDPGWLWTHFPAGELRHPLIGAKLQKMGTKPGWADFLLVSPRGQLHTMELSRKGPAE